jgi:carboxypeptidase C (cathepsin A)
MDGMFLEMGPFRVQSDKTTVKIIDYHWAKRTNVLFGIHLITVSYIVDQPVGTGFSYADNHKYFGDVISV